MQKKHCTKTFFFSKTTPWTHSVHIIVIRTYATLVLVQIGLAFFLFLWVSVVEGNVWGVCLE